MEQAQSVEVSGKRKVEAGFELLCAFLLPLRSNGPQVLVQTTIMRIGASPFSMPWVWPSPQM